MEAYAFEFIARLKTNVELLKLLEQRDILKSRGKRYRQLSINISTRIRLLNDVLDDSLN